MTHTFIIHGIMFFGNKIVTNVCYEFVYTYKPTHTQVLL